MAYCEVDCNWTSKNTVCLASVVIYRTEDQEDENSSPLPQTTVRLEPDSEADPCTLTVNRKNPPYSILIGAVDVLCTARNMEVYSSSGEYVQTSSGTFVGEIQDNSNLYLLQHSFDNPVEKCQLKLLSHKQKTSLLVHSIHLTVTTDTSMSDPLTSLLSMSPSIDLDKVKDILDDMGQEIPDGAKDLFKSVEMHQKSQQAGSSGALSSMMLSSLQASAGNNAGPPQLASFMAAMTGMSQSHMATMLGGMSRLPPASLQAAMSQMPTASIPSAKTCLNQDNTQQTLPETANTSEPLSDDPPRIDLGEVSASANVENNIETSVNKAQCDAYLSGLEARLLKSVNESECRILDTLTRQLQQMETRLQHRMDHIYEAVATREHRASEHDVSLVNTTQNTSLLEESTTQDT